MTYQLPIYDVQADRTTGLWLTEPEFSGDHTARLQWERTEDSADFAHQVYDYLRLCGEETETRAIRIWWVD